MIRSVRREEIPLCVRVIRRSHRTVADQFGITEENAPRYVAFATDENRLLWHMDNEHRLMYLDEEDGVIRGYYSLLRICSVLRTEQIPRGVPVPPASPPGEERSPGKGNPFPGS